MTELTPEQHAEATRMAQDAIIRGRMPNGREASYICNALLDLTRTSEEQAEQTRRLRIRLFSNHHVASCSHSTACSIWGDDGQGGTAENFMQPLPCNCGALLNFERQKVEEQAKRIEELDQRKFEYDETLVIVGRTVASMQSEIDRLRKALEQAPHADRCPSLIAQGNCRKYGESYCGFIGPNGVKYGSCRTHSPAECNGEKSLDSSFSGYDGSLRIWSLREMLDRYAADFVELMMQLQRAVNMTSEFEKADGGHGMRTLIPSTAPLTVVDRIGELCAKLKLDHGLNRIARIEKKRLTGELTFSELAPEIVVLNESILDQLKGRMFLYVPKPEYYDATDLFGADVSIKFPRCSYHIVECGNCLSLQRSTAVAFHAMCVLEVGLDSLSHALGLPFSQRDWGAILTEIDKATHAIGPNSGANWKIDKEFYSECAVEFRFLKDAWRNHTAHDRAKYTDDEALKIFEHVKYFMGHLATRLTERP